MEVLLAESLPSGVNVLRLFVYGTLKRGFGNHRRYCGDLLAAYEARVWGRLFLLPASYPALEVPTGVEGEAVERVEDWGWVQGELFEFPADSPVLDILDELEGYVPGDPDSLYMRVMVEVHAEQTTCMAWAYVQRAPILGRRIRSGQWPEAGRVISRGRHG